MPIVCRIPGSSPPPSARLKIFLTLLRSLRSSIARASASSPGTEAVAGPAVAEAESGNSNSRFPVLDRIEQRAVIGIRVNHFASSVGGWAVIAVDFPIEQPQQRHLLSAMMRRM